MKQTVLKFQRISGNSTISETFLLFLVGLSQITGNKARLADRNEKSWKFLKFHERRCSITQDQQL